MILFSRLSFTRRLAISQARLVTPPSHSIPKWIEEKRAEALFSGFIFCYFSVLQPSCPVFHPNHGCDQCIFNRSGRNHDNEYGIWDCLVLRM